MQETLTDQDETKLVQYSVTDAAIAELREQWSFRDASTSEGYDHCKKGIAICRTKRGEIEKRRVVLKADALAWSRKVDSEAKRITLLLEEIENPLKAEKARIDDAKEREARAIVEAEKARIEAEEKAKRDAEEAARKALHAAEEERLRKVNLQLQEERKAMEEEKARVAAEQAKESAKLKAKQDAIDAENKRIADVQKEEQAKIDADRRIIQAQREKIERAEFERQAKEKAEIAAKEAIRTAEESRIKNEKIAAELAEKEAARIEAARPDVEKIRVLGQQLSTTTFPQVGSDKATEFLEKIRIELDGIAALCLEYKP